MYPYYSSKFGHPLKVAPVGKYSEMRGPSPGSGLATGGTTPPPVSEAPADVPKPPTLRQIERKMRLADSALERSSDTSPISHWSEGVTRLVEAYRHRKAENEIQDLLEQRRQAGLGDEDKMERILKLASLFGS